MTHRIAITLTLLAALLASSPAQTLRGDLFDVKKSQQELEVMRGILSTTLSFVVRELRGGKAATKEDEYYKYAWRPSGISAFYLYGQGAVFIVPSSTLRTIVGGPIKQGAFADYMRLLDATTAEVAALDQTFQLYRGKGFGKGFGEGFGAGEGEGGGGVVGGVPGGVPGGVVGGVVGGVGAPVPVQTTPEAARKSPAKGQPPQAPQGPQPPPASSEDVRRRLAEAQEKIKKGREENEGKRAQLLEQLTQIKGFLIEALANHGDSLTHVKANEYLNLIMTTDDSEMMMMPMLAAPGSTPLRQREVISIQKSWITDYKAGRLSLDALKQKALVYGN